VRRPQHFDAVIFDLDGVVTDTASVHAIAWKALFDDYLRGRAEDRGETFRPFSAEVDYDGYVDGKPRYEGVRSFLASRGIDLPFGSPGDGPDQETVCGLGNRKDATFAEALARDGVRVFPSSLRLIQELAEVGIPRAIASSSKNCAQVLRLCGIEDLFQVRIDGAVAADLGLAGKPAPDYFLKCAELLGVSPVRTAVIEDAISGVQAGRAGGFGLVIGIDRRGDGAELRRHGADIVVSDLLHATAKSIDQWRAAKRPDSLVDMARRGRVH